MPYLQPEEEKEHECNVCGKPIKSEGLCGSRQCFKADQR